MDPTSVVRTDTLPAVATLLVPGAFASAPYVALGLFNYPDAANFLAQHEALMIVLAIMSWVASGFLIESLGSYVEVYAIDRCREDYKQMMETWWRYLRIAWQREPIGQRYLRRLLVSFKFELNLFVATLLTMPGVILLSHFDYLTTSAATWLLPALAIVALVLFVWAKNSSGLLMNLRAELVKTVKSK
jgi:hypothetical protein